jgi:hypothetical protein
MRAKKLDVSLTRPIISSMAGLALKNIRTLINYSWKNFYKCIARPMPT